jgi:hypothetical protein
VGLSRARRDETRQKNMPACILRIEPYELRIEPGVGGESRLQTFWRIYADDVPITDRAHPFRVSDGAIVLEECLSCGNCGAADTIARRVGTDVAWTTIPQESFLNTALPVGRMVLFDAEQYRAEIGSGDVNDLPSIGDADVARFVRCLEFPKPESAVYRMPELSSDPFGRQIAKHIKGCLTSESSLVHLCQVPEQILEVRIGFDLEGFPESIWKLGRTGEKVAIRFEDFPRFNTWITCNCLSTIRSLRGN